MQLLLEKLVRLAQESAWNYHAGGAIATEPAAWACLALAEHGEHESAKLAAEWLQQVQDKKGSVGVTPTQSLPAWTTSLAILAWSSCDSLTGEGRYEASLARALKWTLNARGKTAERQSEIGHDPTLVGWSWAEGTHSWLEPTTLFVMALKAAGYANHPRTREAVRLIVDRLLPDGGCNYGNTMVLGQTLLPHVQPTGLAMLALAGEKSNDPRVAKSLDFLEDSLQPDSSTASQCYAVLGLNAHGRDTSQTEEWLAAAAQRESSCYRLALIALARKNSQRWLSPKRAVEFAGL